MDAFNEVMGILIVSGVTDEEGLDLINELFYEHASMPETQEELNLKHWFDQCFYFVVEMSTELLLFSSFFFPRIMSLINSATSYCLFGYIWE